MSNDGTSYPRASTQTRTGPVKELQPDSVKGRLHQLHSRIGDQVNEAATIAERMEQFVNEMIGPEPEKNLAVPPSAAMPKLDEMNACAEAMERQLSRMRSALSRLGV